MITYAKRTNPETPGSYTFYANGQPFTGPWGYNHNPSPDQLASIGYMPVVSRDYNLDTHKPSGACTDDGAEVFPVLAELTPEEQAGRLTAAINAKYEELREAQSQAFGSLFAGYTPEQRETFWAQVAEAEKWTADNLALTPFLSGRATREGVELQTIVAEVLAMAGYAKAVNGDIYGEFRALTRQLAEVDPAGNYAAELDKLNLIVW
jgi:hypothetical protein